MILNMSHEDKKKYKKTFSERKTSNRKKRSTILSDKTKNLLSKKFDDGHPEGKEQDAPQIDPHVKMNDNYLRTGPYKPKKKSLDDMTRDYTRNRLFYRFVVIEEIGRSEIISMEDEIRKGVFGFPPPVLNGLPDSW